MTLRKIYKKIDKLPDTDWEFTNKDIRLKLSEKEHQLLHQSVSRFSSMKEIFCQTYLVYPQVWISSLIAGHPIVYGELKSNGNYFLSTAKQRVMLYMEWMISELELEEEHLNSGLNGRR